MPRILRTQLPSPAVYHVTARGVDGADIVRDDHDRRAFLALLAKTVDRYEWQVHVFCLMTNHYHVVVHTTQPQLFAGVQYLSGRHAQRFNLRHGRRGHLFGERSGPRVIRNDDHVTTASDYVLDNPVTAGLAEARDASRWGGASPSTRTH